MTIQQIDHLNFNPRVQITKTDYNHVITETNDTLFSWAKGIEIFDTHPFFEILRAYDRDNIPENGTINFPCIHLEEEGNLMSTVRPFMRKEFNEDQILAMHDGITFNE